MWKGPFSWRVVIQFAQRHFISKLHALDFCKDRRTLHSKSNGRSRFSGQVGPKGKDGDHLYTCVREPDGALGKLDTVIISLTGNPSRGGCTASHRYDFSWARASVSQVTDGKERDRTIIYYINHSLLGRNITQVAGLLFRAGQSLPRDRNS